MPASHFQFLQCWGQIVLVSLLVFSLSTADEKEFHISLCGWWNIHLDIPLGSRITLCFPAQHYCRRPPRHNFIENSKEMCLQYRGHHIFVSLLQQFFKQWIYWKESHFAFDLFHTYPSSECLGGSDFWGWKNLWVGSSPQIFANLRSNGVGNWPEKDHFAHVGKSRGLPRLVRALAQRPSPK